MPGAGEDRPELTRSIGAGKFLQVAPPLVRKVQDGVRLILENSTVCHSRRISLFVLPVDPDSPLGFDG